MEQNLDKLIENYLAWDKNPKTRDQIQALVDKGDREKLGARLYGLLSFGTAGIRAPVEGGFKRLNYLTVIQITHGFARHMRNVFGNEKLSVCIGYDGRFDSKVFSEFAANVFIRNDIEVYLFSEVVPTPVTAFGTVSLKCNAGLMITASHNPKEDNGYKVYWVNGAQIIEPHDIEICKIAYAEPQPRNEYWERDFIHTSPMLHSADAAIEDYINTEKQRVFDKDLNSRSKIKFTYSAFHGVGYKLSKRMFEEYGFPPENFIAVKEQAYPDPNFPTVRFPNPEEGAKVLQLCFQTADAADSTVVLANDPDADRLQLAEKAPNGTWRVFSGNEMGTLLTWWVWKNWRERNPDADLKKVWFLNSAVSSQFAKTMAAVEGFQNRTTLTGFKWMGNLADELRQKGNTVVLAWEESIGFMPGSSMDKDGVISVAMFAELATWLSVNGMSFATQLLTIYKKYGFHLVKSNYYVVPNPAVTKSLFADLRHEAKYPTTIGTQNVKYIRDLTTGYDNEQEGNKAVLPLSTSSEMITFTLENGSIATLRASGTEPKVKYYIELITEPGKEDIDSVVRDFVKFENDVVQSLLQPTKYGLIARD
uniref:Phosphoglucomutase (alpha-D-glucose-1,6-bisphosphate-dependent) n=1 Tax=Panagrolaimus superbus TaxID=310955 RepID=A0A914Z2V6_9BILA